MSSTLTLYFAEKRVNDFMRMCGLDSPGKVYATPYTVSFTTPNIVDEKYCRYLMEKARNAEFWIPAIRHNGFLYIDPTITQLSDGEHIYWNRVKLERE